MMINNNMVFITPNKLLKIIILCLDIQICHKLVHLSKNYLQFFLVIQSDLHYLLLMYMLFVKIYSFNIVVETV